MAPPKVYYGRPKKQLSFFGKPARRTVATSAPYRPYVKFFSPQGFVDTQRYRTRNRAFNKPARVIQKAAANMARTKRYNMVRKNPVGMVHAYKRAKASPKRSAGSLFTGKMGRF